MGTEKATKKRGRPARKPSETASAEPVILTSGVDTLHLFSRAPLQPARTAQLEKAQERARKADKRKAGPVVEVAGHYLRMARHGARTAPFLLESDHLAVLVSPNASGTFPTLTIELRAVFLWHRGPHQALAEAEAIADALLMREGAETRLHASRVDLCVDFQGWVPDASLVAAATTGEGGVHFKARPRDFGAFFDNRRFTGLMFGRGNIAARLYDKTTEIRANGDEKAWFASEVWSKCPRFDATRPVWRLEFQLRREAFTGDRPVKVKRPDGAPRLDHAADILGAARALWDYLAGPWLSLRGPRTKNDRQSRVAAWEHLWAHGFRDGLWSGTDGEVYRKARESKASAAVAQLAGYLASVHAYGLYARSRDGRAETTLDEALPGIIEAAREYAAESGMPIEERAQETLSRWLLAEESTLASADLRGDEPREPGSDDGDDQAGAPEPQPARPEPEPRFKVTVKRDRGSYVLAVLDESLPRWDQTLHVEAYDHIPTTDERRAALALVGAFGRYDPANPDRLRPLEPSAAERIAAAVERIQGTRR